jgi:hypothetical protein
MADLLVAVGGLILVILFACILAKSMEGGAEIEDIIEALNDKSRRSGPRRWRTVSYPPEGGRLYEAWRRARRRSICQDFGVDPESPEAVGAEFIVRPHEALPHELEAAKALGRKLARRFGW